MKTIWDKLPKPFFALAPMEGVTDIVFRNVILKTARPDIFFTEFVNATSFCSKKGEHSTRSRLEFCTDENPIIVQIWGNKPEEFAKMSQSMSKDGFDGIDINMGCPDKAVVRTGSGSALIKNPALAGELIFATKTGGLPVSVKTRLGDVKAENWKDWLSYLLEQNLSNLTVHLRTRKEMSKVKAHYELIPDIITLRDKLSPATLLTINGDIRDREHGEELTNKYGVDGIMIGRGIFENPFAFEKQKHKHNQDELVNLLKLHLDLFDKYSTITNPRKFDPLKQFFKIYIRDFDGASNLRAKMMQSKTTEEVRIILKNYEK